MKHYVITLCAFLFLIQPVFAQTTAPEVKGDDKPKAKAAFFDGVIVGGYVDEGGFLNFTGPNLSLKVKSSKFMVGMLPSLRFKDDKSPGTTNAFVMPTLGLGLTYTYKHFAFQVPVYYNAKTATKNGGWVVGVGIGLQLKK